MNTTDAYEALLADIEAKHNPHCGWESLGQLPKLSDDAYMAILLGNPDVTDSLKAQDVAELISERWGGQFEHPGAHLTLTLLLRRTLFDDLQERRIQQNEIERDPYTHLEREAESKLDADRADDN